MTSRRLATAIAIAASLLAACSALLGIDDRALDPGLAADAAGADGTTAGDATRDGASDAIAQGDAPLDAGGDALDAGAACDADAMGDPHNCGACGHDCLGGACEAGTCGPVTLATGQPNVESIASDGTSLFWTTFGADASAGSIVACAKSGCAQQPQPKAQSQARPIQLGYEATFANLWWADEGTAPSFTDGKIVACKAATCTPSPIATSQSVVTQLTLNDPKYAYWTETVGGTVMFTDNGTFDPQPLASGETFPSYVAANGQAVYWASGSGIRVAARDGDGGARTWADAGAQGIAADATRVYWTDGTSVFACATSGCAGPATPFASSETNASWLVADDARLYWISASNTLRAVAKTGGAPFTIVQHADLSAFGVDATAIYWATSQGDVTLVAK